MSKKDDFNGIYIELTSEVEGHLSFGAGLEFTATATEEYKTYMETLLAGIFCIISTDLSQVEALGAYVRDQEGFAWNDSPSEASSEDGETAEENLLSERMLYKKSKLLH